MVFLAFSNRKATESGPYPVSKRVHILGTFFTFWVPIYVSRSLFSVFWVNLREELQFSLHHAASCMSKLVLLTTDLCVMIPYLDFLYGSQNYKDKFCVTILANSIFPPVCALDVTN